MKAEIQTAIADLDRITKDVLAVTFTLEGALQSIMPPKVGNRIEAAFEQLKEIGERNKCGWELDEWKVRWLDSHIDYHHALEAELRAEIERLKDGKEKR